MQWVKQLFKLGQCAITNHMIYQKVQEIFYVEEVWFVTEQHVLLLVVPPKHVFPYHFEKALNIIEIIGRKVMLQWFEVSVLWQGIPATSTVSPCRSTYQHEAVPESVSLPCEGGLLPTTAKAQWTWSAVSSSGLPSTEETWRCWREPSKGRVQRWNQALFTAAECQFKRQQVQAGVHEAPPEHQKHFCVVWAPEHWHRLPRG